MLPFSASIITFAIYFRSLTDSCSRARGESRSLRAGLNSGDISLSLSGRMLFAIWGRCSCSGGEACILAFAKQLSRFYKSAKGRPDLRLNPLLYRALPAACRVLALTPVPGIVPQAVTNQSSGLLEGFRKRAVFVDGFNPGDVT